MAGPSKTPRKPAKKTPAKKAAASRKRVPDDPQLTATGPSDISAWKKPSGNLLELPSGRVARVKNPGIQAFMTEGLIPNSLMPIVQKALTEATKQQTGKPGPKVTQEDILDGLDLEELLKNPEKIRELTSMLDSVTMYCFVEPKVYPNPDVTCSVAGCGRHMSDEIHGVAGTSSAVAGAHVFEPQDRRDDRVYIDELDDDDKQFVFNWAVGGTADVARFRRERARSVDVVLERSGSRK